MTLIVTALVGLSALTTLAGFSMFRALSGDFVMTWGVFALWLGLLTAANGVLALSVRKAWPRLSLRAQALAILWLSISLWYWTVAPLFFFLSMNVNAQQLSWTAFAFLWEVPVVGGGLFISLALAAFYPFERVLRAGKRLSHPEALYRWTLWYPRVLAAFLFLVSVVGYGLGTLQLRLFAGWPLVEQVKNIIGGGMISLFLAVFLYLVFDIFLGKVRERLKQDYAIPRVIWRHMSTRVILVTTVLMIGSVGLLGFIAFDALQFVIQRGGGTLSLSILANSELVNTFSAAVGLVLALTVGFIIFFGQALTKALRFLSAAVAETQQPGGAVPAVRTADELEALSQLLGDTIGDLSRERNRLREAKIENEAIFDSMGEALVVVDQNTCVIRVNQQAERLLGWTQAEFSGKPLKNFTRAIYPNGRSVEVSALDETLALGKSIFKDDYTYAHKNGRRFPVAVTAAALILNQKIVGAVMLFRDITREKAIDQAKTEFVSIASHQLRTPLTAMNWYVELLLREQNLTDSQRSDLKKIRIRGQRMVQLVNALLNVSRLEAGRLKVNPVPTDLVELINSLVDELLPFAHQRGCQVIFHKSDDEFPDLPIDRSLLRQVLHNLFTNAIKYSPSGQGARVWVQLERSPAGAYVISVQDNGIGIPENLRSRIFDKFFRADKAMLAEPDGTGLGLYVAKKIIAASGGKIWFESTEGRGTTFFVEIPKSGMQEQGGVDLAFVSPHA